MISRRLQITVAVLVLAVLGMGFYLAYLKRKAESIAAAPVTQPLTAPVNGPTEVMTLYLANDEEDALRAVSVASPLPTDPGERGRLALHMVISRYLQKGSAHPLGAGAEVHDVYLLDPASAVVNLNATFADTHRSGIEVEQLTVLSLIRTLKAQLPEVTRVRFLVDGKTRDTLAGHVDLSGWMDVGLATEACKELQ
jgi:hypothetical protein